MSENNIERVQDRKASKEQKKKEKLAKYLAKIDLQKKTEGKVSTKKEKAKKGKGTSEGYDSTAVEAKWIEYWKENQSFFSPVEPSNKPVFSIIIPPPNITGCLHIGHAILIAIEDTLVRYKRNTGHDVLYLPGLDHAGISTQDVVMKNIATTRKADDGTPFNVSREYFLERANEWAEEHKSRILGQFDRLGTSVDYSKLMYTLDPKVCDSVNKAFVELHKKGLIYRANKIVNWSGKLKTCVSEMEVTYKAIKGGSTLKVDDNDYKMGYLYYFKYHIFLKKNYEETMKKISQVSNGNYEQLQNLVLNDLPYVVIATTRPETILGDTAICVNPNDERFANLEEVFRTKHIDEFSIHRKEKEDLNKADDESKELKDLLKEEKLNKYKCNIYKDSKSSLGVEEATFMAINPLTHDSIDVIFDEAADLSFGTGILKVTPSHDKVDYALGKKHKLKNKVIINEDNRIVYPGSVYHNLRRYEARTLFEEREGCLIRKEAYDQIIPFCSKSKDIIEPRLIDQWWVNCDNMAKKAVDAVKSGEIELYPVEAKSIWYRWLENIDHWCISRQLWWGHRIPAWSYKTTTEGNFDKETLGESKKWIIAETFEEAKEQAKVLGVNPALLEQDTDVLDTWFSSGLWAFSTLGWGWDETKYPNSDELLKKYFPTTLLETGSDILFFWVGRMAMLSYELTGSKPFSQVLLHGLVRDAHGRKMSKSLGNVIDPLFVIDGISKEGLVNSISPNVNPDERKRASQSIQVDYPNGIPKCGTDALRFALLSYFSKTNDINLDVLRVVGYSRFCNKLWHAYKFIAPKFENITGKDLYHSNNATMLLKVNKPHHLWLLNLLNNCINNVHESYKLYNFMNMTKLIYTFFLNNFCDVYIELCKQTEDSNDIQVLNYVFIQILLLFNPPMPFVTEEIHYLLKKETIKDFPSILELSSEEDVSKQCEEFEKILSLVKSANSGESVKAENEYIYQCLKKLVKKEFQKNIEK